MLPPISVRTYGVAGASVVVVHGGPGAPGHLEGLARDLSDEFRVYEPLQRGSGEVPLTVGLHVEDLFGVMHGLTAPAVIGSSWGAMLALATVAAHPDCASSVVLMGSGTFDLESRAEMKRRLEHSATPEYRRILDAKARGEHVPLARSAQAIFALYTVDPVVDDLPSLEVDERANRESWEDMLRLQAEGTIPQCFARICCPVLMLHGENDPHPGAMIRSSLLPFIPHMTYREWPRCGHYPWIEREHRAEFLAELHGWLRSPAPARA